MSEEKKVIIIGAGEVGSTAASSMEKEGFDVCVIENNHDRIEEISDVLDIKTVHGNGGLPKNLEKAGAKNADILLALSDVDEVNLIASQVAYSLFDVKIKMARVYSQGYTDPNYKNLFNDSDLAVDYVISPEKMVADRIVENLELSQGYEYFKFDDKEISFVGFKIKENFKGIGLSVADFQNIFDFNYHVMLISRGYKNFVPSMDEQIHKSDIIYFVLPTADINKLMKALGEKKQRNKNILIVGGGNTGFFTAKQLEKSYNVKLLEKDLKTSEKLAIELSKTSIIHADAMNFRNLDDINVEDMDVVINLTDSDEVNSLCSMYERQKGVEIIYTLVKNNMLGSLTNNMRFSRIIAPRDITVTQISKFIRNAKISNLHSIQNGEFEIAEVKIPEECKVKGMKASEFNALGIGSIGVVIKPGVTIWNKESLIESGDRVVVIAPKDCIKKFYEYV